MKRWSFAENLSMFQNRSRMHCPRLGLSGRGGRYARELTGVGKERTWLESMTGIQGLHIRSTKSVNTNVQFY